MQRILFNLALMMPLLLGGMATVSADTIYTGYFSNKGRGWV